MIEPAYSFTLPSLHDNLPLLCRLYYPKPKSDGVEHQYKVQGAVIAHPYAPLGGCYDDAVVLGITESLVEHDHIVCTFNFRGATGSEGKTSWTGRPELDDFASIAGFMAYHLHHLTQHFPNPPISPTSPTFPHQNSPSLLLTGYSYGSLILTRLPSLPTILHQISNAPPSTPASELFLRSRTLAIRAHRDNLLFSDPAPPSTPRGRETFSSGSPSPRSRASPVTLGGEESERGVGGGHGRYAGRGGHRRRQSGDRVRELPGRIRSHLRRASSGASVKSEDGSRGSAEGRDGVMSGDGGGGGGVPVVEVAYLLISPVLVPLTTILAPPGLPTVMGSVFGLFKGENTEAKSGFAAMNHSTFIVFGAVDTFTSAKRLQQWVRSLEEAAKGKLEWMEVAGAGHFWREPGVMQAMKKRIMEWRVASHKEKCQFIGVDED